MTGRKLIINGNKDNRYEPGILTRQLADDIRAFTKNDLQGYMKDSFFKEIQNEFDNTMKSIEKYGGFYIGRYETGNVSYQIPVIRRLNTDIGNINLYNMYMKMKNVSNNENININIIWGCLWDETLQWIIETGDKTKEDVLLNTSNWSNCFSAEFTYTDANGRIINRNKLNYNYSNEVPTGSTERNKANNIYDLAGNFSEWTLESEGTGLRYIRGGDYRGNGISAAARSLSAFPQNVDGYRRLPCVLIYHVITNYFEN